MYAYTDIKIIISNWIGFDVIGDMGTARGVYGLSVSEREYMESLRALEMIAMKCGVSGIAAPTARTVRFARENGFEINYYGMCCGRP